MGRRAGGNSLKPSLHEAKERVRVPNVTFTTSNKTHTRDTLAWDGTTQDQRQIWGVSVFFLAVANKGSSSLGWMLVTKGKIIFKIIQRVK